MPTKKKTTLTKLSNEQVNSLKGKLLEVRRIGASQIFITVSKTDKISDALKRADIPDDDEIKVEAIKDGGSKWEVIELSSKAADYKVIAVTTKVSGAY